MGGQMAFGALSGSSSSSSSTPRIETKSYGELEKGLNFGTSGSWGTGNRNIEGMSTQMVPRNDAGISNLARQQFNLSGALLQPQFQQSRTKVSNALASRGLGQTSSFANAMTDIAGKEQMAQTSLLSNILKSEQQDSLARSQLGAQMEMSGLTSRNQRMSSRYGLEGQRIGAMSSMYSAQQSADASAQAGKGQAIGSVGSAALMMFSDKRLKKNIKKIGALKNIINIYKFKYIDAMNDAREHIGVMAQELIKILPEAVLITNSGYYAVDYGLLNKVI